MIRNETQKMCVEADVSYLLALKHVPDWFVTSKMIEKLDNAVFFNDNLVFGDIDAEIVTFISNGKSL